MAKKKKLKFTLDFNAVSALAEELDGLGGDIKSAADDALQKSAEYIDERLHERMKKHNKTHKTDKSILDDAKVVWSGNIAEINVGFDISHGGLASVFLMYGTPQHEPNHPGTEADRKLYNAIYGSATKRKIKNIQKEVFEEAVRKRIGG